MADDKHLLKEDVISITDTESRGRKSTLGIPFRSGTKEYAREYYKRNREKMNERMKQYHKDHPEKARKANAKYSKANPEKVRDSQRNCQKNYRETIKAEHEAIQAKSKKNVLRFEELEPLNKGENHHGTDTGRVPRRSTEEP